MDEELRKVGDDGLSGGEDGWITAAWSLWVVEIWEVRQWWLRIGVDSGGALTG